MGSGSAKQQDKLNGFFENLKSYNVREERKNYQLLEHFHSKEIIQLWKFVFQDKDRFNNAERDLIHHKTNKCICLLQIYGIQAQLNQTFCSDHYTILFTAENYTYTLGEYLETRGQMEFKQEEICHLLDCVSLAQINLKQKQYLDFSNIYFCQKDLWKLSGFIQSPSFIALYISNLSCPPNQKILHVYPAPEEIVQQKPSKNDEQGSIFGFAMIILHVLLGEHLDQLYDGTNFKNQILQEKLQQIRENLSPLLFDIINQMLDIDPFKRISYKTIQQRIQGAGLSKINSNVNIVPAEPLILDQSQNKSQIQQVNQSAAPLQNIAINRSQNLNYQDINQSQNVYQNNNQYNNDNHNQNIREYIQQLNQLSQVAISKTGKIDLIDGCYYEGDLHLNKMHGQGKIFYENGKIAYEGEFYEGEIVNFAIHYNRNPKSLFECFDYSDFDVLFDYWDRYEGNFFNNKRDGYGMLILTNGEKYIGGFKQNKVHGFGQYYLQNGQVIHCYWENNKLQRQI